MFSNPLCPLSQHHKLTLLTRISSLTVSLFHVSLSATLVALRLGSSSPSSIPQLRTLRERTVAWVLRRHRPSLRMTCRCKPLWTIS
jgi:hypothetical protein